MRSANKAEVIPNAVDGVFFKNSASQKEARKNLGLPVTGKLIGVPGTLRPMKGHPFFFKAAAHLMERFPGIQVAISGSGEKEYVENLKKTVSDYGIEKNVMFLQQIYVYVDDVDKHFERAKGAGALILAEVEDQFYGDRRYGAEDPEGHHWYFAQHVRDVAPEDMKRPE